MTEKKTFKNVEVVPYAAGQWGVRELNGSTHGFFPAHEWDMEVTFTKKEKSVAVGDTVTDGYYDMRVVAIENDQAWCYNFISSGGRAENFYSTEWLRDLKHADS